MILIIGVGNRFMGDDGCGSYAAEILQNLLSGSREVEVVDLGSGPIHIIHEAERLLMYKFIIIIDATLGIEPGNVEIIPYDFRKPPLRLVSSHSVDIYTVFALLKRQGYQIPPILIVGCGVEEGELTPRLGLSEKASKAVALAVERTVEILKKFGVEVSEDVIERIKALSTP